MVYYYCCIGSGSDHIWIFNVGLAINDSVGSDDIYNFCLDQVLDAVGDVACSGGDGGVFVSVFICKDKENLEGCPGFCGLCFVVPFTTFDFKQDSCLDDVICDAFGAEYYL